MFGDWIRRKGDMRAKYTSPVTSYQPHPPSRAVLPWPWIILVLHNKWLRVDSGRHFFLLQVRNIMSEFTRSLIIRRRKISKGSTGRMFCQLDMIETTLLTDELYRKAGLKEAHHHPARDATLKVETAWRPHS